MTARKVVPLAFAAAVLTVAGTAGAEPWSRGYVVEWYEPASYYGGPKGGTGETPGTDCPKGSQPANDYRKMLLTSYRTQAEVDEILDPNFNRQEMYRQFVIRGPNRENVLLHPTSIPDPGMYEVQGQIAYGFNLDGDARTGFTSPTGEKGVDNAFYKTAGCTGRLRGGAGDRGGKYSNDGMRDGVFTVLIVVSGEQSPENDSDARFAIYLAKDPIVKDANSGVAWHYTFRVSDDQRYQTVLPVKIKDGLIENVTPQTIRMRSFTTPAFFPTQLELHKGRIRFQMKPDGTLAGMIGGYRDWLIEYAGYSGNGSTSSGAIHENVGRTNLPAYFYALRRNADGLPHPVTGKNMGISMALRVDAVPAMVATPDGRSGVQIAQAFK